MTLTLTGGDYGLEEGWQSSEERKEGQEFLGTVYYFPVLSTAVGFHLKRTRQ